MRLLDLKVLLRAEMADLPNLSCNEYNLAVPQPRTEFYKRSLSYSGSVLWNSLPLESGGAAIDIS